MNRMRFFTSYKEAHETLHLPGSWQQGTIGSPESGLSSIKLTVNPKSLDRISQDLKTLYYVGKGDKRSPGEPAEPQQKQNQQVFYTSRRCGTPVTVLMKIKTGVVVDLGLYRVVSVHRVAGLTSLDYYHVKLVAIPKG